MYNSITVLSNEMNNIVRKYRGNEKTDAIEVSAKVYQSNNLSEELRLEYLCNYKNLLLNINQFN